MDFTAVADPHDENAQHPVLNLADHSAAPDPVTPQALQRAGQHGAQNAGIIEPRDPRVHVVDDAPGRLPVELSKLSSGGGGVLNRPGQDLRASAQARPGFADGFELCETV